MRMASEISLTTGGSSITAAPSLSICFAISSFSLKLSVIPGTFCASLSVTSAMRMFCMMKTPLNKKMNVPEKTQGRIDPWYHLVCCKKTATLFQDSAKSLAMVTGRPEPLTQHEALGGPARERDCFAGAHRLAPSADSLQGGTRHDLFVMALKLK